MSFACCVSSGLRSNYNHMQSSKNEVTDPNINEDTVIKKKSLSRKEWIDMAPFSPYWPLWACRKLLQHKHSGCDPPYIHLVRASGPNELLICLSLTVVQWLSLAHLLSMCVIILFEFQTSSIEALTFLALPGASAFVHCDCLEMEYPRPIKLGDALNILKHAKSAVHRSFATIRNVIYASSFMRTPWLHLSAETAVRDYTSSDCQGASFMAFGTMYHDQASKRSFWYDNWNSDEIFGNLLARMNAFLVFPAFQNCQLSIINCQLFAFWSMETWTKKGALDWIGKLTMVPLNYDHKVHGWSHRSSNQGNGNAIHVLPGHRDHKQK